MALSMSGARERQLSGLPGRGVTMWTAGNAPTQQVYGLTANDINLTLRAQFLLSRVVVASASFFFESPATREVTHDLMLLFEKGEILYFIEDDVENYREHGLRRCSRSVAALQAYRDREVVLRRGTFLEALGQVLRRPAFTISRRIVRLWLEDLDEANKGFLWLLLGRRVPQGRWRRSVLDRFRSVAMDWKGRDFVWEYVLSGLQELNLPRDVLAATRHRLSELYTTATRDALSAGIHGSPDLQVDDWASGLLGMRGSDTGSRLFLDCLEALGVKDVLGQLSPHALLALKRSDEFLYFRNFYFRLLQSTQEREELLCDRLIVYRSFARSYREGRTPRERFLANFRAIASQLPVTAGADCEPLDLLLRFFDAFGRDLIEDVVSRLRDTAPGDSPVPTLGLQGRLRTSAFATSNSQQKGLGDMKPIDVFISHSHKDAGFAKALVAFIERSLQERPTIRATSVDGYKLRVGSLSESSLRDELNQAKVVVAIVTGNSLSSLFVLFELGAAWGMGKQLLPIFGPDIDGSRLQPPLASYHGMKWGAGADWHDFLDCIAEAVQIEKAKGSQVRGAVDDVIAAMTAMTL